MAKKNKNTEKSSKHRKIARAEKRKEKQAQKRRSQIISFSSIALIILAVAAFSFWPRQQAAAVDETRLALDPKIGPDSALVTIVEFADFGCHGCQAWHNSGTKERILETYGDKVQFVWRDFPVITAQSPKAAEAGQCALDQGKFWEYHDLVYERGRLGIDSLKAYAQETELDTKAFNTCLNSGQHRATVERDLSSARKLRLRGTPSFIVNNRVLPGPPRYEQLATIIDEVLDGI